MIKEVTGHHSTKAWPSERPSLAQSAVSKVLAVHVRGSFDQEMANIALRQ
jgi:hypothetical protein